MEKDDTTPPGNVTPLAAGCDDSSVMDELGSDILRSRLLQLYLARVLVNKNAANDPDECNSMRVEDDDADYADRRAFFDEQLVDEEEASAALLRHKPEEEEEEEGEEEEEEEDTVGDEDSDEGDLINKMEEIPRISRAMFDRRSSLQLPLCRRHSLAAVGNQDADTASPGGGHEFPLGSSRPSPRTLEARRLAHFLQPGRRGSLQAARRSPLEASGAAATPEELLEGELGRRCREQSERARLVAWRMESEMRSQWTRRGSLQTDVDAGNGLFKAPFAVLPRRGSAVNLHSGDTAEALVGAATTAVPRTKSEVDLTASASPLPPPPTPESREVKMKRREMNIMAPVSF